MRYTPVDNSTWDFNKPVARLRGGHWNAQIDVSRPQLGLHQLQLGGATLDGQLLCVSPSGRTTWPANVADAYVRGHDVVAAYEPMSDWPYAPQVYWRADPAPSDEGVLASLSLLVSIQTSLLDTHPRVDVVSHLPADEVLRVAIRDNEVHVEALIGGERTIHPRADVCCVLRRLPGKKLSCAEFMPASDFQQVAVDLRSPDGGGECHTQWELFSEFLEKGVIRRARLQLALVDREHDVDLAAACCRHLTRRPLPLTT